MFKMWNSLLIFGMLFTLIRKKIFCSHILNYKLIVLLCKELCPFRILPIISIVHVEKIY